MALESLRLRRLLGLPRFLRGSHFVTELVEASVGALAQPELCPVVVARSGIEVNQYVSSLKSTDQTLAPETLKHEELGIPEELLAALALPLRDGVECLVQLRLRFVEQLVKPPVGLRIKFIQANSLSNIVEPRAVFAEIDCGVVKRHLHALSRVIDDDREAAICPLSRSDRLTEAHLGTRVLPPCLLVWPPILRQEDSRNELDLSR